MKNFVCILACSILLFACSDDDKTTTPPDDIFDNSIEYTFKATSRCTYTMYITGESFYIDWGDGTIELYESEAIDGYIPWEVIKHSYASNGTYHIKIQADNIEYLQIDNFISLGNNAGTFENFYITKAPKLKDLLLGGFHGVKQYHIANCPLLESVKFYNNNTLEYLDFSSLTSLKSISLDGFKNLKNLDLSKSDLLEELDLRIVFYEKLDFSNLTNLKKLTYRSSGLENINISSLTNLISLDCSNNKLTDLDLSNTNLSIILCHNNELKNLTISNNPRLEYLACHNNMLNADILNRIFTDLPDGDIKQSTSTSTYGINILNNPGVPECDKTLFINKYWTERTANDN